MSETFDVSTTFGRLPIGAEFIAGGNHNIRYRKSLEAIGGGSSRKYNAIQIHPPVTKGGFYFQSGEDVITTTDWELQ